MWDHAWYWYYSKKCAESGIEEACSINRANQSQADLERMAQDAFNRGVSNVGGLRFKVGYADNPYCREMEYYAGNVYTDSFPTNVQRVDPNGSVTQSVQNAATSQKLKWTTRAWNWVKSWF